MKRLIIFFAAVLSAFNAIAQRCEGDCNNGIGTYYYENGNRYEGQWKDGQWHGKGKYYFTTGDRYEGDFANSIREGIGAYYFSQSGAKYIGEWKGDRQNGQGTYYVASGAAKSGLWENGKYTGFGCLNGDCMNGTGIYKYPNNEKYEGSWKEGKKSGYGSFVSVDGSIYEGNWKDDKRNGEGKLLLANGTIQKGVWENDKHLGGGKGCITGDCKNGYGTFYFDDGGKYLGTWKDAQFNGKGTYTYINGDEYTGMWKAGKKSGAGTMKYGTGSWYEGNWENNQFNGKGTFFDIKDKTTSTGTWQANECVDCGNKPTNNTNVAVPVLKWISPSSDIEVQTPDYQISICIKTDARLSKVALYINQVQYENVKLSKGTDCNYICEALMKLSDGKNEIELMVVDEFGKSVTEKRYITASRVAVIIWELPQEYQRNVTVPTFTVKARVESCSKISNIQVLLNDVVQPNHELRKDRECYFTIIKPLNLQDGENKISIVVETANGKAISDIRTLIYAVGKPPAVTWILPDRDNATSNKQVLTLKAYIESNLEITKSELFVNNVLQPEKSDDRGLYVGRGFSLNIERNVMLNEGANSAKIIAYNQQGQSVSEIRTINYTPVKVKESRIALVIGNAHYKTRPLRNPINDANDMADLLREKNFEVIFCADINLEEMLDTIEYFGKKLKEGGGTGLFYYSGHGLQLDGVNYLVPVDADITKEAQIKYKTVNMADIMQVIENAQNRVNIVVLDACRDNPFKEAGRSVGSSGGYAELNAARGTIIAYATKPGSTASDGVGDNGLYTQELVRVIREADKGTQLLKIEDILKQVRISVLQKSNEAQIPWENSSLIGDFYF